MLRRHYPASSLIRASPSPRRGRACPSRASRWRSRAATAGASRVALVSFTNMPSPLPRRDREALSHRASPSSVRKPVLRGGGLPRNSGGSAPASPFSRPAQRSLALRPACSLSRLATLCHRRLRQFRHLHCRSDCFRLERPVAGWVSHPRKTNTFTRRTELLGYFRSSLRDVSTNSDLCATTRAGAPGY